MTSHARTTTELWVRISVGMMILGTGIYALTYTISHDVAWWLYVAESMMQGQVLYRDLIEINPPLYGYMSMIPVVLTGIVGLDLIEFVKPYYLFVFLLLATWGAILLKSDRHDRLRGPLAMALAVLVLIGLPGVNWAQREHVMFALFLPYLLTQTRRRLGLRVSPFAATLTGIASGLGIALKPHFVLMWLAVELMLWLRTGRNVKWLLRPELWFTAILLAGYGGFVLVAHPAYVQLLIEARHLYMDFSSKPLGTLLLRPSGLLLLATSLFFWFQRRRLSRSREYALDLLVFASAAWVVALLQAKGWSYHFYPTLGATTLAAMLLIVDQIFQPTVNEPPSSKADQIGTVLFGALVGVLLTLTIGGQIAYDNARTKLLEAQIEYLRPESIQSLLIMSPRVPDSFPIVNRLGVEWASPFPHLWWLQSAHGEEPGSNAEPPVPQDSVEVAFRDQLIERMRRLKPEIVLVDASKTDRFSGKAFPYVAYMYQDARFRTLWGQYERTGTLNHFEVYTRRD